MELARFSPAAARLLEAQPRLARFLSRAPAVDAVRRVPLEPGRVRRAVRILRARVFVHTAARELAGVSPLDTARLWSDAADAALDVAARMAAREVERKLGPPLAQGAPLGRAIFALGKLGSRELNPSSDIDLLVAYEKDGPLDGGVSAHEWHVHWTRRVRTLLHDVDHDGFAFRVDLDLRPEGTAGPLANSVDALESYYERFGQTWERAALLRLRAVVDVGGVGAMVEKRLRPFVFPRSVDARAVDELFAMKHRVTASAGDGGFDVKRGRGGIREVEFVAQALQLLHGGRIADLRTGAGSADNAAGIVELLQRLERHGLLPHKNAADLAQAYVFLRRVEHGLQYGEDRQTQTLPDVDDNAAENRRVALAVAGAAHLRVSFDEELAHVRERVHAAFTRLLGEGRDAPSDDARRAIDRTLSDDERVRALTALGFADGARALTLVRVLEKRRGSPLSPEALRGGGAAPAAVADAGGHLIDHVAKSPDPMAALARLPDLFLERVPRAALGRVVENPRTLALAARLLATSAPLSRLLAKHHGLEEILARTSGSGAADARLSRLRVRADLEAEDGADEEARLVGMRRVHGRRTLANALAFFGGRVDVCEAALSSSSLADGLIDEAVSFAREKIEGRHGALPSLRFVVVGLGSLGGRELGFFRDLDLLFVYDAEPDAFSDGARSVGAGEYAARLAQQVIWALTAPLAEGACYAVDSRLRPSGSQGALTTSLASFVAYHERASAPWEKQALLRARFVAGDRELGRAAIAEARRAAFAPPPASLGMRLLDMRAKMVEQRASSSGLDLKMGDGGVADVEFAVQGLQMTHGHADPRVWSPSTRRALRRLTRGGYVTVDVSRALEQAYLALVTARDALGLVDDKREPAVAVSDARLDLLARAGVLEGRDGADVYERLASASATIRELSARILLRLG